jgi:hypothetical protein
LTIEKWVTVMVSPPGPSLCASRTQDREAGVDVLPLANEEVCISEEHHLVAYLAGRWSVRLDEHPI